MIGLCRDRYGQILIVFGVLVGVLFLRAAFEFSYDSIHLNPFRAFLNANSTLGLGSVLVVSGATSSRREGLLQAANVTDLDITIPEQPRWTDEDEKKFRDGGDWEIGRGTVFAWLGHNFVLNWWLKERDEDLTLVLEDDVDWDIRLRSVQVPRAARAIRQFFPGGTGYWGNTSMYDLLWIGHCGDYWHTTDEGFGVGHQTPQDLEKVPHMIYEDDTIPPRFNQHPFTASLLTGFNISENHRVIHASQRPLCTFGYIITREAAKKVVEEVAPPKAIEMAFDVAILHACNDKRLRCWSVNPELFHQMEVESLIGKENVGDERIPSVEESAGLAQVLSRNESSNIDCGFFDKSFRFGDDEERLHYLREEVGRKGRCLKPGRDLDDEKTKT